MASVSSRAAVRASHGCVLCVCALAAGLPACSSGGAPGPLGTVTVTGDARALRVDVTTEPDPLQRGSNVVLMAVTDLATGAAQDGIDLAVVPWMPAMGHGTSVAPVVTAEGGGQYRISQVELIMPGLWELRTTLSGAVTDHVAPSYDIP